MKGRGGITCDSSMDMCCQDHSQPKMHQHHHFDFLDVKQQIISKAHIYSVSHQMHTQFCFAAFFYRPWAIQVL